SSGISCLKRRKRVAQSLSSFSRISELPRQRRSPSEQCHPGLLLWLAVPRRLQLISALQRLTFHPQLTFQPSAIPDIRSNSAQTAFISVFDQAILGLDITVNYGLVPFLGVAGIVDGHIVMLAPEERNRGDPLAIIQHITSNGLSLPLRDDPMFHPDIFARI